MIDICLFGSASVFHQDRAIALSEFTGVKPRHLLYLLALNGGSPISKDRLAGLLWHDEPPASWLSTLEGYVSLLRRALQAGGSARQSVVVTSARGYALDANQATVDVDRFDSLCTRAEALCARTDGLRGRTDGLRARTDGASPEPSLSLLTEALSLATGDLLEGERNVTWVVQARSQYQQRVRRAAVNAGRLALLTGDLNAAGRYAHWACDLDPFSEDAWHVVIEAQWRSDRRVEALRSFITVRSLLDRELGILPSRSLQQLHTAVLRDEPLAESA